LKECAIEICKENLVAFTPPGSGSLKFSNGEKAELFPVLSMPLMWLFLFGTGIVACVNIGNLN
jgi:hypothetical protein